MKILAIETSCDETAIAVLDNLKIVSNIVASQVEIHKKYGGVYPALAKREHQKNLPLVLKEAIKKANNPKIDAIAVTIGPGLEPCLWTGVNFARDLAKDFKLKIIPVNHIAGHIYANFISQNTKSKIQDTRYIFPAIALVVSGGHTQLILMRGFEKFKIIGETLDDAAGEAFDKTARILGLGYPGGPTIAAQAAMKLKMKSKKLKIFLPRPMINSKDYNFSFSGLKTAVLYDYQSRPEKVRKSKAYVSAMAAEIQQAVIDVLIKKTVKAARNFRAKSIILGGGVAANNELRRQFRTWATSGVPQFRFLVPPKELCTDNAAMIGAAAYFKNKEVSWKKIGANANLRLS